MKNLVEKVASGSLLKVVMALIILAIVSMQSFALWRSYAEAWHEGERDAANLTSVLSSAMERDFSLLEITLEGIAETLAQPAFPGLDRSFQNVVLFHREAHSADLGATLILDAGGNVRFDNATNDISRSSFADREYFQVHQADPDRGTYLSGPFTSRLSGAEPAIAMSRRLAGPDGAFAGVAAVAVRFSYFKRLLQRVVLPEGAVVLIVQSDGTILLREPSLDGKGHTGQKIKDMANAGQSVLVPGRWTSAISPIDGKRRFFITEQVGTFPLMLTVGLSAQSMFGPWYARAVITLLVTLAVCLLLALTVSALASSLRRSRAIEAQLEQLAVTDALTGLPNRRALDLMLRTEMSRSRRDKRSLVLLMVDIDHFKRVNDTYGHAAGDVVLAAVASRVVKAIRRPGDFVCRYGGEEFLVVLPDTSPSGAEATAERIRASVADRPFAIQGAEVSVTVSVGISPAAEVDEPGELIARVDAALYTAKRDGRNRVARLERLAA